MHFHSFNFDSRIQAAIDAQGYTTATPIQEQAIPLVLGGHDVLGLAQTGTGKTAAFVLPILQRLLTGPRGRVRALIVAPTRELAEQIHSTIVDFGVQTRLRSITIYGGVGNEPQVRQLKAGAEIIVACPGRLLDHIAQKSVDFSTLEVLVLDEADRMFDMGFLPDIRRLLKHMPSKRQTLFFSATMPDSIRELAKDILRDPLRVQIGQALPATTVTHALFPVESHLKTALLLELLEHTDTNSVLVFTRTKHRAKRLAQQIERAGYKTTSLHGNRSQNQRQAALDGFRNGTYQILVATDIAARGLDVENITHVINYDIPDTADAYIHRIGRTGRAAKTGDAFTLVTSEDTLMIRTIERAINERLPRRTLPAFDYKAPEPARNTEFQREPRQPQQRRKPVTEQNESRPGQPGGHPRPHPQPKRPATQPQATGTARPPRPATRSNQPAAPADRGRAHPPSDRSSYTPGRSDAPRDKRKV